MKLLPALLTGLFLLTFFTDLAAQTPRTRAYLWTRYETGDKPTQTDYRDVFASFFSKVEDSLYISQLRGVDTLLTDATLTGATNRQIPTAAAVKTYVDNAISGGVGAVTSVFGRTGGVTAGAGDYNAGQITNTPAGSIAATTVQAALNELDSEKLKDTIGSVDADNIATGAVGADELASSGVTLGTYGSDTQIPVITVDADGRITSASNVAAAGGGGGVADGDKTDIDVSSSGSIWTIDTSAVTTVKIANDAVTGAKIAASTIDSTDIATGGIGNTDLQDAIVTAGKIATGAVNYNALSAAAKDSLGRVESVVALNDSTIVVTYVDGAEDTLDVGGGGGSSSRTTVWSMVDDFGADPTDTLSDQAAFNLATQTLRVVEGQKILYAPAGTYVLTDSVNFDFDNLIFQGDGVDETIITVDTINYSIGVQQIEFLMVSGQNVRLENFSFDGRFTTNDWDFDWGGAGDLGGSPANSAVRFYYNAKGCAISNVKIRKARRHGLHIDGSYIDVFNVDIDSTLGCNISLSVTNNETFVGANHVTVKNCAFGYSKNRETIQLQDGVFNVTFDNIKMNAHRQNSQGSRGIAIYGHLVDPYQWVRDAYFSNIVMDSIGNDDRAIFVYGGLDEIDTTAVWMENIIFENLKIKTGRVEVTNYVRNVTFDKCEIESLQGIKIGSSQSVGPVTDSIKVNNVKILNSRIVRDTTPAATNLDHGISINGAKNIRIDNTDVIGFTSADGIMVEATDTIHINACKILQNGSGGINVEGTHETSNYIFITNNVIKGTPNRAIRFGTNVGADVFIVGNDLRDNNVSMNADDILATHFVEYNAGIGGTPVEGSGADNQIALWSDVDTLAGSNNFMFDGNKFILNRNNTFTDNATISIAKGSSELDIVKYRNASTVAATIDSLGWYLLRTGTVVGFGGVDATNIPAFGSSVSGLRFQTAGGALTGGADFHFNINSTFNRTSGNNYGIRVERTFTPSSGTATWGAFTMLDAINQSSGATGITWGMRIKPTLTSVADFRGFWYDATSGTALYIPTGNISNWIGSTLGVGGVTRGASENWFSATDTYIMPTDSLKLSGTTIDIAGAVKITGATTATGDITVPAEAYSSSWNGSNEVPTKNDVYDAIQSSDWTNTVTQSGSDTLLNSAAGYGHFQRIGNVVSFTLRVEIALTSAGDANTVYIDPPIASNFTTAASDVIGTATMDPQTLSGANTQRQRCLVFASDSDDKIGVSFDPVASLTYPENRMYISVSGSYVIQ